MKLFKFKDVTLPIIGRHHVKHIHLIGIGGSGMCGIAIILMQTGYYVTGSDIVKNDAIQYLSKFGVQIFLNHCMKNINQADIVVRSSAVRLDNPEVLAAKQAKIPVITRTEVLSELMRCKYSVAVSGTHGKTTTTTMLTSIYIEAGLDPTFVIGGITKSEGVQARLGRGNYLIAEVDESDQSFLCLYPVVEIITNIDTDHMNAYHQSFEYLQKIFIKFLNNLPIYGYAVVCFDDPIIRNILPHITRKIITYGFSKDADLRILHHDQCKNKNNFVLLIRDNVELEIILHSAPGRHNALNATAAIAVAMEEGINDTNILKKSMYNFQGTTRRFEYLGKYSLKNINGCSGTVMLIDDYGHHPTELCATIQAIRSGWPNKRLVMIFQPHRFTRTCELYNDFINILSDVDILFMLNIYSAGEEPILGINSQSLCDSIYKYGKIKPIFVPNEHSLLKILSKFLKDNDLILTQGAGTIGKIAQTLFY